MFGQNVECARTLIRSRISGCARGAEHDELAPIEGEVTVVNPLRSEAEDRANLGCKTQHLIDRLAYQLRVSMNEFPLPRVRVKGDQSAAQLARHRFLTGPRDIQDEPLCFYPAQQVRSGNLCGKERYEILTGLSQPKLKEIMNVLLELLDTPINNRQYRGQVAPHEYQTSILRYQPEHLMILIRNTQQTRDCPTGIGRSESLREVDNLIGGHVSS
ncbi:Uncharacterised protein [Mycobacteroides abscessus subsp. massiliense]|nr:Uncharacterised protein [Mycobacteroides abscessus subsp. massiliense]